MKAIQTHLCLMLVFLAGLLTVTPSQAGKKSLPAPQESPVPVEQPPSRLLRFGVAQRLTFRENQGGPNLSWMPTWEPELPLGLDWMLQGSLGGTVMSSNRGNFPAFRTGVGVSYRGISDSFFPEWIIGAETWSLPEGGVGLASGLNFHHSFNFKSLPVLRALSSAYWGFHWAAMPDHPAYQVNLGVRWGGR